MAAPAIIIPLYPIIGAGAAAIGTFIATRPLVNSLTNTRSPSVSQGVLTPQSTPNQFTDASANYLSAYAEYESQRAKSFSALPADKDVAKDVATKYNYVEVDEASGRLGIAATPDLANGGSLVVDVETNIITYSNNVITKKDSFINYGTDSNPSAVPLDTPINIALSEDGTLPLIVEKEVQLQNRQIVATTVIESAKIDEGSPATGVFQINRVTEVETQSTDVIDSFTPGVSQSADVIIPRRESRQEGIGPDVVAPNTSIEDAVRTAGYLEDTPSVTTPDSTALAGTREQAAALERQDAESIAAGNTVPGRTEITPPPTQPGVNKETGQVTNTAAVSQEKPSVNNTGGSNTVSQGRTNPLHDYVNWTYKFTWYALSKEKANLISTGRLSPGGENALTEGAEIIVSSGGTKNHTETFPNDMYFGNVSLETIVGLSSRSRGTDLVNMSFEVIEPYNATLLPRLVTVNNRLNGNPDWGMGFYLLKLEFLGYDEEGNATKIDKTTKYFPIQLVDVNFKVGPHHTRYNLKGVPYHHYAQTALDNTIPSHMEIVGGTIEDIFNGAISRQPSGVSAGGVRDSSIATTDGTTGGNASGPITKGVAIALNDNEKYIVKGNPRKLPNTYKFEFKDGIGGKKVYDAASYRALAIPMSNPKSAEKFLTKDKSAFRIQAGTKISDLVNIVLAISDYYIEQVKTKSDPSQPTLAHKIIPQVEFKDYDCQTKTWQRNVTYVVSKYLVYGNDSTGFGQKAPPGFSKSYKWLFTGQNKDVLNVDIDYKVAFFDLKNTNEKVKSKASTDGNSSDVNAPQDNECKVTPLPARTMYVSTIADQSNTGPRDKNAKTLSIEEYFKKQFDSAGDNITLNLTIVGDPDLIQQDNLLYNTNSGDSEFINDGSLNFQKQEVYFNFEFKSPMKDYDDTTGLFQVNDSTTNLFNGLYRIISVKSEFNNGRFTQQIQNYRVRTQSNSTSTSNMTSGSARPGEAGV